MSVILSGNQFHRLHHTFFVPTGEIRASLLIVHGMSEHSGRYAKFAQFLANHGILVLTYDQLGHGQTVKDKYELGFIDEKHPVQALCKDVVITADALKAKAHELGKGDIPHFIMGHSMGSFVVRAVLAHHARSFAGAIIMGTGNSFGVLNRLVMSGFGVLNFLNAKKPNLGFATALNQYLLNQIRSPIWASPFAWLSENQDNIKAFEADPLCGFPFSNNGFLALQGLIRRACRQSWYGFMSDDYPLLLVSGKDDPVGHMGQDIEHLTHQLQQAGKTNITVHLYPNMRHEPLQETHADMVYQDILRWFNANIF